MADNRSTSLKIGRPAPPRQQNAGLACDKPGRAGQQVALRIGKVRLQYASLVDPMVEVACGPGHADQYQSVDPQSPTRSHGLASLNNCNAELTNQLACIACHCTASALFKCRIGRESGQLAHTKALFSLAEAATDGRVFLTDSSWPKATKKRVLSTPGERMPHLQIGSADFGGRSGVGQT